MNERRFFTLDEANAMVPWLKGCFGRILQLRSQLRSHYHSLEQHGYRHDEQNLSRSDAPVEVVTLKARLGGLLEALRAELDAIIAEGIEIKDPDQGLCDFWTLYEGKEVYLCWRFGEDRIDFYHEPHAGFAGRKPLPAAPTKPRILH